MAARFHQRRLSIAQQRARMQALYPGFTSTWERGLIRWTGDLQPTDVSERYRIAVAYRLESTPKVRVLAPALRAREDGEPIPHRYPEGHLCLYLTNSGEWTANDYIAETTVPWTSLWLYYYEVWHATGEWLGGGVHPPKRNRPKR
jgi:hypothetical protein